MVTHHWCWLGEVSSSCDACLPSPHQLRASCLGYNGVRRKQQHHDRATTPVALLLLLLLLLWRVGCVDLGLGPRRHSNQLTLLINQDGVQNKSMSVLLFVCLRQGSLGCRKGLQPARTHLVGSRWSISCSCLLASMCPQMLQWLHVLARGQQEPSHVALGLRVLSLLVVVVVLLLVLLAPPAAPTAMAGALERVNILAKLPRQSAGLAVRLRVGDCSSSPQC